MAIEMLGKPRITNVSDAAIAWTEVGSGPPLVMLHGLGDSHRTWRRVLPELSRNRRVLLADLPGHGLSSRPDAPYTIDWYARTMHEWLDDIGVERATVFGHSFGGGVAQWMLLQQPTRIDRLGLVAPGGLGRDVSIGLRLAYLMGIGTHIMMRTGQLMKPEPQEIARIAWMNSAPGTARAFCRTVSGCMNMFGQTMQSWDRIHEVNTLPPLGVFWGDRDRILPVKHALDAAERIEGAMLARYERAGHFPQLEEAERFTFDVRRFMGDVRSNPRLVPPKITVQRPSWFKRLVTAMKNALRPSRSQPAHAVPA
jgi:pimeloyl-ACP methyl ester carboxylesterase